MQNYQTIIWDWNGTLLNDIRICVNGINVLLKKREIPQLTIERYREIFTFPVKAYYEAAGFDFSEEPFDIPAMEFINIYTREVKTSELFPDAIPMLEYFKDHGYRQAILSAMEHNFLIDTLSEKKIVSFFEHIAGINNHYAYSKLEQAVILLQKMKIAPAQTVMVGDTIHDFEIAKKLGCRIILVSRGHQSEKRLRELDCDVINNLAELKGIF